LTSFGLVGAYFDAHPIHLKPKPEAPEILEVCGPRPVDFQPSEERQTLRIARAANHVIVDCNDRTVRGNLSLDSSEPLSDEDWGSDSGFSLTK
jgi:hypothetical protein